MVSNKVQPIQVTQAFDERGRQANSETSSGTNVILNIKIILIFTTWHSFWYRNSALFLTSEWSDCFLYKWKFSLLDSKSKYFGTTIFLDWRPLLSVHGCHTDNDWPKPTPSGVLVQSNVWKKRTVLFNFGRNRFCSLCLHHDWVFIPLDLSLWIQSTNSFEPTCWRISNPHWTQRCSVVQVCNWKHAF